jgi:hypothetical protein
MPVVLGLVSLALGTLSYRAARGCDCPRALFSPDRALGRSKLLRVPGGRDYQAMKTSRHAAFYRDAEAARAAGYRQAKR